MTPKWPGMSDAEWADFKAYTSTLTPNTYAERRLLAEVDALRAMVRQQNENLTAVQARCTSLVDENRGWRRLCAVNSEDQAILGDIVARAYRVQCKYGEVKDDLPDGTGDTEDVEMLAEMRQAFGRAKSLGILTRFDVLMCEVAEVRAESHRVLLRNELLDVIVGAMRWIQAIDLRGAK